MELNRTYSMCRLRRRGFELFEGGLWDVGLVGGTEERVDGGWDWLEVCGMEAF